MVCWVYIWLKASSRFNGLIGNQHLIVKLVGFCRILIIPSVSSTMEKEIKDRIIRRKRIESIQRIK